MKKYYRIFITDTSKSGRMKTWSFSSTHLRVFGILAVLAAAILTIFTFDYTLAVFKQAELKRLRVENAELEKSIHSIGVKVSELESSLERVEDFSSKLKSITTMGEGGAHSPTAIGPLPSPYFSQHLESLHDSKNLDSKSSKKPSIEKKNDVKNKKSLEDHVTSLQKRSTLLKRDIWMMIGALEERKHLLEITPSISPAQGRVTSHFGYRGYPIQLFGRRQGSSVDFHQGLDIAASRGTKVVAPAGGVVFKTGYDSSTGNYIVLDHGYDLKTLYGHLDSVYVKINQEIKRGERIGSIGSTGRSTGPHLHYEIRISGQSVNPEYYILNL